MHTAAGPPPTVGQLEPPGIRLLEAVYAWRAPPPDGLELEPRHVAAALAAELRPSAFERQWDADEWRPPG